jgi:hypothetical protein
MHARGHVTHNMAACPSVPWSLKLSTCPVKKNWHLPSHTWHVLHITQLLTFISTLLVRMIA